MKNILKKIGYSLMVASLVFGYSATDMTFAQSGGGTHSCSGASGNLYGYIDTENLGPVYLSTESWNDLNGTNTTVNFSVNYDRQMGIWSGRGWAAGTSATGAIGWVDFSYNQINDEVRFVAPGNDYDNNIVDTWGNWTGVVDLSGVVYSNQNGSFQGTGLDSHVDTGGVGSETDDDYVGSGEWTFEQVQFQDPACPQNVNLFLEGTSRLHRSTCDINNILIQWTTENVTNCTATAGLWTLNTPRLDQNTGTTTYANNPVTDANTPVMFKLQCTGAFDNQPVEGIAIASCGVLPTCEGENCPFNIISPVIIEA